MNQPVSGRPHLADLPELATRVGLAGSTHQTELGGTVCFGLIIAVVNASQAALAITDGR